MCGSTLLCGFFRWLLPPSCASCPGANSCLQECQTRSAAELQDNSALPYCGSFSREAADLNDGGLRYLARKLATIFKLTHYAQFTQVDSLRGKA